MRALARYIVKLPRKNLKSLLGSGGEKEGGQNSQIILISSIRLGKTTNYLKFQFSIFTLVFPFKHEILKDFAFKSLQNNKSNIFVNPKRNGLVNIVGANDVAK